MQRNTNIMVTGTNNTSASVKIDGEPLNEVSSIKHLPATQWNYGTCNSETRTVRYNQSSDAQIGKNMQEQHQLSEKECFLNFPRISFWENKTNDYVQQKVICHVGREKPLRVNVKRRNMAWIGHLTRQNSLCKTIIHDSVEGGRKQGQPCYSWSDRSKVWIYTAMPDILRTTTNLTFWKRPSSTSEIRWLRPSKEICWWWCLRGI